MARMPRFFLPLLLLPALLSPAAAQDSFAYNPPAEEPYAQGHANQGASIGEEPERVRLPPVTLAQHVEPLAASYPDERLSLEAAEGSKESSSALSQPLKLRSAEDPTASESAAQAIDPTSSMITVGTSLAVVLGLFFVLTYFIRRNLPKGVQPAPGEVLEVLGRAPLPGKQQLQVVRFGSKLVLLSVTNDGVEAVSEITDPDEVQQLTALCRRETPGSSAHAFHEILSQMGREPAKGFVDQSAAKPQLSRR